MPEHRYQQYCALARALDVVGDRWTLLIVRELAPGPRRFPDLLEEISAGHQVHKLVFFGQELAKYFHDYYESCRIIDLPQEESEAKLYLVQQFAVFMRTYFGLLGIKPLEKM
jgi:arginyl-tRNA synthetase